MGKGSMVDRWWWWCEKGERGPPSPSIDHPPSPSTIDGRWKMSGGKWRRLRKEVVGVKEGHALGHTPLCNSFCISQQHELVFIKTLKHSMLSFHISPEYSAVDRPPAVDLPQLTSPSRTFPKRKSSSLTIGQSTSLCDVNLHLE